MSLTKTKTVHEVTCKEQESINAILQANDVWEHEMKESQRVKEAKLEEIDVGTMAERNR